MCLLATANAAVLMAEHTDKGVHTYSLYPAEGVGEVTVALSGQRPSVLPKEPHSKSPALLETPIYLISDTQRNSTDIFVLRCVCK